jgi:hypothetical protein
MKEKDTYSKEEADRRRDELTKRIRKGAVVALIAACVSG